MGTYKLPSQRKSSGGSGSKKLAAFKEATSGSGTTQTPSEYRESTASKSSEEISARQLITSSGERAAGIDRTQQALAALKQTTPTAPSIRQATSAETQQQYSTPSPVKDVAAWQAAKAAQIEDRTAATGYFYSQITRQYEPTLSTIVGKKIEEETEEAYETLDNKALEKKQLSEYPVIGKYVPEKYASVVPTTAVYLQSQQLATSIRESQDTEVGDFIKISTPGLTAIGGSVVESGARLVEFGGVIPAGVETLVTKPETIKPALIVGGLSSARGIYESVTTEPGQFVSDIGVQAIIGYGIGKGASGIKSTIKYAPKTKVPVETLARPEVVMEKVIFPTAQRGTPITEVISTFKETSTRYPVDLSPELEYGIHVSGTELPKKLTTLPGTSETPGLYVGPDASLYFARIMEQPKIKLFGADTPKAEPSISFVGIKSIERLPSELRANIQEANVFMTTEAIKATGYTTVKMETGLKYGARERELVIPPESRFKAVESKFYTEYKGKKIPITRYEPLEAGDIAISKTLPSKLRKRTVSASDIYSSYGKNEYSIITPSKISKTALYGSIASSSKFSESVKSTIGISSISNAVSEQTSISKQQYEPINVISSTSESLLVSRPTKYYDTYEYAKPYISKVGEAYKKLFDVAYPTSEIIKPKKKITEKKRSRKIKSKKQAEFTELVNPFASFKDVFGFRK